MAKAKNAYVCSDCGYKTGQWLGKCPECGGWGTLEETAEAAPAAPEKKIRQRPGMGAESISIADVPEDDMIRHSSGILELDRVLGGGVVEGSMVLVGGDPGIGKSTLLTQVAANLAGQGHTVLYVSGEESVRQIRMRASRLGISGKSLFVLSENDMDAVEKQMQRLSPSFMVVDSIQTMYRPEMSSAPGSVSQVRESASLLMRLAKASGCAIFLVGHVTKEGAIAGPRILEHMVDAVLYFEGDGQHQYRILRAVKNRFGSVNELGMFEMRDSGMHEVPNASEVLLSSRAHGQSGSVVLSAMEGSRPILVDVQALVATTVFGTPRRMASGVDLGRLALLLAVLEKRAGMPLYNQDVYINVAGGLSLSEPASDLALCLAAASSLKNLPIGADWAVMGEVGLAGEVRAVGQVERRVNECLRMGFTHIVLPKDNAAAIKDAKGAKLYGVSTVHEACKVMLG